LGGQRRTVEQFYEAFSAGDLDAATAMFGRGVRIVDPGLGAVEGLEALRGYLVGLKEVVPDARAVVERVFEVADVVIVEGRFTGTSANTGSSAGMGAGRQPASREVDLAFADFARVRDGQIVEYRTYYDQVSLLTQLGQLQ
jgi:ketosteroid isomerase-like protein